MSIWIRSQDKMKLGEISSFSITKGYFDKGENFVEAYSIEGMGIYFSQEKARKVLDMIGKHIYDRNCKGYLNGDSNGRIYTQVSGVFEMPQDSAV